ncbi:carboxylesterase family protein [Bacteriovorax sp. PP10]|uniref:Carboxylic ester hydrolase n=1 Tax=Bacteriovorax antarcticus TaxID=3088717 RepID=A0ABU5VQK6_9BACT|nr:carboxylesterase family protein [Bacteriovorax sp. PP10]MEA9355316.1 carboxylesterase family protein [Bacteriovorax sp. PP10]
MYRTFLTNLCALLAVVAISQTVEANSRLLEIEKGQISGVRVANDVDAFLGIPYAAPPVGPLRWKAPRPAQPWDGVLKANKFPTACPQLGNFFANVPASQFGKPVGTEDCLYLNVWRPAPAKEKQLPVVVWIHGGSNFKGTSADPMYDGKYLASKSNIVMVSLNYRIGLLGAISYKALENGTKLDKSGNFVTLDLIQGLKWVHDNIKTFGGDPNNVTIMGQSAGCMNVWGLLQTPLSEGLFHKAVCSSGLPNIYPKAMARARSGDFVENLVFNARLVADRKDAGKFIEAKGEKWVREFLYSRTSDEIVLGQDYSVPVQHIEDEVVFPHGLEATALGFYQQVPMILGSTMDEATYLLGTQYFKPDLATLWGYLQNTPANLKFEDVINTNYVTFRTATKSTSLALNRTISNIYLTARLYNSETYRYNFEWNNTPQPWKDILGSVHGMDAIFYLGNFDSKNENFARFAWTEENRESREALREEMNKHFTQFFWTGNPGWKGTIDFK